jgi:hypothetical protein
VPPTSRTRSARASADGVRLRSTPGRAWHPRQRRIFPLRIHLSSAGRPHAPSAPPHLSDLDGRRSPTIRASCDPSLSNDLPHLPRLNSATAWSRSTLVAVQGRIGPCGISDGGVLRSRSFFCSTWSFSAISSGANSQMCAQGGWGLCAAVHRPSATAAQRPLHEKEPARDQHDPPCQRRSERYIRHPGTPNTWRTGTILRSPGAE